MALNTDAKFEGKLSFVFKIDMRNLGKFSPEHFKVSKLGLWWDSFIQRRKGTSLKFTGELFVMTMKKDARSKEELTCCFKIGIRTLMNFDPSTHKSKKCALSWALFDQSI